MRLSEAIRMGSLLIEEPRAGDVHACAITMAGLATGFVLPVYKLGQDYYTHVNATWPWLRGKRVPCPCGQQHMVGADMLLHGNEIVWGVFDHHVMNNVNGYSMTIEGLADWIRTIEPEEHETVNNNPLDENDVLSYSDQVAVHHES
jgi:hypothetical protein